MREGEEAYPDNHKIANGRLNILVSAYYNGHFSACSMSNEIK